MKIETFELGAAEASELKIEQLSKVKSVTSSIQSCLNS